MEKENKNKITWKQDLQAEEERKEECLPSFGSGKRLSNAVVVMYSLNLTLVYLECPAEASVLQTLVVVEGLMLAYCKMFNTSD